LQTGVENLLLQNQSRDTLITMAANVLVVTHDLPFGEFIRQSLEETGRFHVHVTKEVKKAISFLLETDCTLAFIDSDREKQEILAVCRRLRETRPGLRFIIIAEEGWQSALEELTPENYLSKPFYLPDLLDAVEKIYPEEPSQGKDVVDEVAEVGMPPWLSNVNRAAQHLTRLTLESSAQAALITNQDKLWAYAGQLPQTAARELAETVTRYWDRQEENDLVRFVRLVSTEAEHMLYATRLATGTVLALVFDAETPFSTIRSQASQLSHSLAVMPSEQEPVVEDIDEEMSQPTFLSDILSDVPSPNPSHQLEADRPVENTTRINRVKETVKKLFSSQENGGDEELESTRRNDRLAATSLQFSRESSPAIPLNLLNAEGEQGETHPQVSLQTEDELAVTVKSKSTKKMDAVPDQDDEGEREPGFSNVPRKIVLEPVSASVYNLDYVCLLVPRFTHHLLTGDLSERMGEWVQQICIAFGWRLEFISVRPEYLQWIVNVPPATSPAYLMRILRQHTSEKIFTEFPRLNKENPSGDFWAPGYLIMGGSQPPPTQLIKDYITQTRQRQGFSQPIRR
jgi:REP element-mobilizing transposase RayT/DNA-binding response OmpR family regulator